MRHCQTSCAVDRNVHAATLGQVADFGLARSLIDCQKDGMLEMTAPEMTDYVATRWYRAPEILAGSRKYGVPVDMWSLGCIFGEMIGGKPVFAGSSTLNQFEKIVEVIGKPTDEALKSIDSMYINTMLDSLTNGDAPEKTTDEQKAAWTKIYPTASPAAIDLLTVLIQFDPNVRLSADQGLHHPYCSQFHDAVRNSRLALAPQIYRFDA